MLDAKNSITLFSVNTGKEQTNSNALVMCGCDAIIKSTNEAEVYSEFEEASYYYFNSNIDSNQLKIEFCFANNQKKSYQRFYVGCFSIRTDTGIVIKVNRNETYKQKKHVKININNELVIGISIFLESKEIGALKNAKIILIEGWIALDNKNNCYGISAKISKQGNQFVLERGNTYRYSKWDCITNKVH